MSSYPDSVYSNSDDPIPVKLTNDMMFHYTMSKCNLALKGLISSLLRRPSSEISNVHVVNQIDYNALGKAIILDTRVEFNDGETINIEMQTYHDSYYIPRSLVYLSRCFDKLGKSENYSELRKTYHVGILSGVDLFPEHPELYSRFIFFNPEKCYTYSDLLEIHILTLDHLDLATEDDFASGLVTWSKLFLCKDWKELDLLRNENPDDPIISEVIQTMYDVNADTKQRSLFEAQQKYRELQATLENALAHTEADLNNTSEKLNETLKALEEKIQLLKQSDKALKEKDALLVQSDKALREKDALLVQNDKALQEKDALLQEANDLLLKKEAEITKLKAQLSK